MLGIFDHLQSTILPPKVVAGVVFVTWGYLTRCWEYLTMLVFFDYKLGIFD